MKITKVTCRRKKEDDYLIVIKMKNRPKSQYGYRKGNNFITKKNSNIELDEESFNKVIDSINEFDLIVSKLEKDKYVLNDICINYYQNEVNNYDMMIQYNNTTKLLMNKSVIELLDKLSIISNDLANKDLFRNILYLLALKKDDVLMQLGIKLVYDLLPQEEIKELLTQTSEAYNKEFVVKGINDTFSFLLLASGYKIAHNPAFAMRGSTRLSWTLNPYTNTGVDAAKEGAEAISFNEFIRILGFN